MVRRFTHFLRTFQEEGSKETLYMSRIHDMLIGAWGQGACMSRMGREFVEEIGA